MPRPRRSESCRKAIASGFTLVEVLVALTILGVGILGVMAGFTISMRAASANARLDEAAAIAQRELDLAVACPPEGLQLRKGASGAYGWTVEYHSKPLGQVQAQVVVSWPVRGETRTFELSELFLPSSAESE